MNRKLLKTTSVILILFLSLSLLTISVSSVGFQTRKQPYVYVSCGKFSRYFSVMNYGYNMNRALNNALVVAKNKASENRKAYVYVSEGEYEIHDTLMIYSHTVLLTSDATFNGNCNMLRNGFDDEAKEATRHSGAKDIMVIGGKWKMNVPYELATSTDSRDTHSTFRFAHCTDISVSYCDFLGNYNAHDIELGGAYKVSIENCSFTNEKSLNKFKKVFGKEAIQLDVNTEKSMPHIPEFDYTASENITVNKCTFKNKFTGIGSHHGVIGNPYTRIKITNNTFSDIAGIGISGAYWYNTEIGNNKFENVGSGIELFSVSKPSSNNIINSFDYDYEEILKTIKNSQTFVYGNQIKVRSQNNPFKKPFGIKISGSKLAKNNPYSNLKKGTYYFNNLFMNYSPNWAYATNDITGNTNKDLILKYIK